MYHLDLYRVTSLEGVAAIGFADMIHELESMVVIEWPERLGKLLPDRRTDIRFETQNNGSHKIQGVSYG